MIDENIFCCDCLAMMGDIPQNAFIISDPPYNQKYHYDNYEDDMAMGDYKEMLFKVFGNKKSVIIHYPEETIGILATLGLGECREVVSWVYNSNTAKQHRLITWWNCKPDFNEIPQDYKNKNDRRIRQRIEDGCMARGYDWWEIDQVKNVSKWKDDHSCPMPLEVMQKIILSTTRENDLIIDPFCGSGTTLVAAKSLHRRYVGIDISEHYCQIAKERLRQEILF